MNICMIVHAYYPHDEARVRREAEALVERGDNVDVICLRRGKEQATGGSGGVNFYRLPVSRHYGANLFIYMKEYLTFLVLAAWKLALLHRVQKYQIVHVHTPPDFLVFAALVPRILGTKIILDIHDLMPELYASKFEVIMTHPLIRILLFVEKISYKFSNYVIAVTDIWRERFVTRNVKKEKCSVIMNLPDERIFRPITAAPQHCSASFNLIYHGTLTRRYGLDIAIKAVSLVKNKIPNIKFNIYGNGEILPELLDLVKRYNLGKQVYFSCKFLPLEQMPYFIAKADIGISPRRKDAITNIALSSKLFEYIAMGIPVVVSRTKLTNKYLNDTMVMFFEPGNEKDLADKILYLYEHPEKRKQLAKNALNFFKKYNWQAERQKYYKIIDELCQVKAKKVKNLYKSL